MKEEREKRLETISINGMASRRRRKMAWTTRTEPQQLKKQKARKPKVTKAVKAMKPMAQPHMSRPKKRKKKYGKPMSKRWRRGGRER